MNKEIRDLTKLIKAQKEYINKVESNSSFSTSMLFRNGEGIHCLHLKILEENERKLNIINNETHRPKRPARP